MWVLGTEPQEQQGLLVSELFLQCRLGQLSLPMSEAGDFLSAANQNGKQMNPGEEASSKPHSVL